MGGGGLARRPPAARRLARPDTWSKELWCVPGPEPSTGASPVPVHAFGHLITGIVEIEPDVFIVSLSDGYTTHESYLARVDLTGWTPGEVLSPQLIFAYVTRHRASTIAELRPGT